jgi:hypothetical protein
VPSKVQPQFVRDSHWALKCPVRAQQKTSRAAAAVGRSDGAARLVVDADSARPSSIDGSKHLCAVHSIPGQPRGTPAFGFTGTLLLHSLMVVSLHRYRREVGAGHGRGMPWMIWMQSAPAVRSWDRHPGRSRSSADSQPACRRSLSSRTPVPTEELGIHSSNRRRSPNGYGLNPVEEEGP